VVLLGNMMIAADCRKYYYDQKELNRENIFPFLDKKTIQKGGIWWTLLL
jgi:hypothetical protein